MSKFLGLFTGVALAAAVAMPRIATAADWPSFGSFMDNSANAQLELTISTANVASLAPKFVVSTGGYVSARAAVVSGVAYFPDSGGNVWAVNAVTGAVIWSVNLKTLGFPAGTYSRSSPAVDSGRVVLGTQMTASGAYLLALNSANGSLLWSTKLDPHPKAVLTAAPVIFNGVIYQGVASQEEVAAATPTYPCCSFRGSIAAVNENTGAVLWQTYTVPPGYSGGGVWGSHAAVDPTRNKLYISTGDNYSTPTDPAYVKCIAGGGVGPSCLSPKDHFDSVLALDLTNGQIKWSQRLWSQDAWNVGCNYNPPGGANCPNPAGPDYDFASAPQEFFFVDSKGVLTTLVGAGQKSGVYAAFNPDTGALVWATQVGPGSTLGGIQWGSATDVRRIYVAISNYGHHPYASGPAGGTAGSWNALDPATGRILWRTPDPAGALDLGPMAVSNGVVYAPSSAGGASQPNMFALDASSGKILWKFASGGSVIAGASISNGTVYWGSGYNLGGNPLFTPGNKKFYAFSIGGL
ncbi:MAG: outer membrane protein assembly factor BamB, containings PQQ-like beta-propeller repeat [Caulobacteraceae bacterium]|nr:outer membrane protein assembly factor BamB, containings PQQ-like beta-propeller repeat [Caulobacteraceae bacterium]